MGSSSKYGIRFRMAILRFSIFYIVILLTLGCNKDDGNACFTSVGDMTIQERSFSQAFSSIRMLDNATVTLRQGPEYSAVVRGGSNLIDSYKTTVEGSTLVLENETNCDWIRDQSTPFEVLVTMPEIDSVEFNGYGDLYTEGLFEVNNFKLTTSSSVGDIHLNMNGDDIYLILATGAANIWMEGTLDYIYVYSTSYSILDLEKLDAQNGYFINGGTGDFKVNVHDYLKVKLDLTGDIYYTNEPEVYIESQMGSGQLIHY